MSEADVPGASADGVTPAVPGSVDAADPAPGPDGRPRGRRSKGRLAPVLGTARLHLRQALEDEGYLPRNMARGERALNSSGEGPLRVLVALSGGPDSLALAATTAFYARGGMFEAGAVVVDHQLQEGSAEVARRAAEQARDLGLDPVQVVTVTVPDTGDGPEASARIVRHAALEAAARDAGAQAVLLGHTLDDQAEQVLLALARGSGTRALSGIPRRRDFPDGAYLRPFLDLRREDTEAVCEAEGLEPWQDPSNADPAFARSRVRTVVMPFLEQQLGPGVAASLHRSAHILAADAAFLDAESERHFAALAVTREDGVIELPEQGLRDLPEALRVRVVALAVTALGGSPSYERLQAAVALLKRQGSAGPVQLPGKVSVHRLPRPKGARRGSGEYGKLVLRSTGGRAADAGLTGQG
ncbi:tRNA(Ile)-lysidine synthase [Arthrobacter woluwensis]|uniref:tRNA lysidine(34) synthetase TilS n=1 Tax=Arthrobacter woluwensis TaxID=156980 RepID=UPI0027860F63|nr:tRNA lysidine(34) synthetase TilS [Arthrobacter woluwensis]MDQ0710476.1 tRNA(Ile)-lysidine synthase [Arthrobacter woluwensis]